MISKLKAHNFRNYMNVNIKFSLGVNVLLGDNGQGKTNLLELIHIATSGDSFRPGGCKSWLGESQTPISVELVACRKKQVSHEIKFIVQGNKKSFFLDQKKVSPSSLPFTFPSVLFSPECLSAIKGGPDIRRLLLDEFLRFHSPGAVHYLKSFQRVLQAKNKLLRDAKKENGIMSSQLLPVLDSINPYFLESATKLICARWDALKAIQGDLSEMMKTLFPLRNGDILLNYMISGESVKNGNKDEIYKILDKRMKELRNAEIESGVSLVGPHKHDIQFLLSGRDARYFCSQGEQRGIILSFKMAQIMYHYRTHREYPILLLDDVLSELDQERKFLLISTLKGIQAQILMTTTDLSQIGDHAGENVALFLINDGKVKELSN